ncbi:hypothetical protein MFLAVUS_000018 [Mucor flavus]|uniref:Uncharacterized protein n=1 Tax=Mucor flavus TaxID=439312 RepID=A0ABP9YIK1_9FUNG
MFAAVSTVHPNTCSNAPKPAPEASEFFKFDSVKICGNFTFDRKEEAQIYEAQLERLQRWIFLNNFRPLSCLKERFFREQSITSVSQKILAELFSVDRDTRLKELLKYFCRSADEDGTSQTAKSIAVIILVYFGIPIMTNDDHNGFKEFKGVPQLLNGVLCSSHNLFLCDFMLHDLIDSAAANEIISKHDLNTLSSIDTPIEYTRLANFLRPVFTKPVKKNTFGIVQRATLGDENDFRLYLLKVHAGDLLKEIQSLQTVLKDHDFWAGIEVADTGEEEENRRESLGSSEFNRHLFSKAKERRKTLGTIEQKFRNLAAFTDMRVSNYVLLLGDVLPESFETLKKVQKAYRKLTDHYIDYQRLFEEFELGCTLLGMVELADSFKRHTKLCVNNKKSETVSELSLFQDIHKTVYVGIRVATNLKRTWNTYVESLCVFQRVQTTYQDSIDKFEQEYVTILDNYHKYDKKMNNQNK